MRISSRGAERRFETDSDPVVNKTLTSIPNCPFIKTVSRGDGLRVSFTLLMFSEVWIHFLKAALSFPQTHFIYFKSKDEPKAPGRAPNHKH